MTPGSASGGRSRVRSILLGCAVFTGLSIWSRYQYAIFNLVVIVGIFLPIISGWRTSGLAAMGFSRTNLRGALFWGILAGVFSGAMGLTVLPDLDVADDLTSQLLIGLPLWILIISPFQEFFFRGWLQSGLAESVGQWWGLLIATIAFTAWHYLSPIIDMASFPLNSWYGILSTFLAGLAYGYAYMKSGNIVSPWLAHTFSGIVFVAVGAMDFTQALI